MRRNNSLLTVRIDLLRAAFAQVKHKHPFKIDAMVVLPEHLHGILTLPKGDTDFSTRWGLIKAYFSRHIEKGEVMWTKVFIRIIGEPMLFYPTGIWANNGVRLIPNLIKKTHA